MNMNKKKKVQNLKSIVSLLAFLLILPFFMIACQGRMACDDVQTLLSISSAENSADLTCADLREIGFAEGYGGIITTTDRISKPELYSGVPIMDLVKLVASGNEAVSIQVESEDGYAITFSSLQVEDGNFLTYDPETGEPNEVSGLQTILAQTVNGEPLDKEHDGTLRLRIISEEPNQVSDGHWSVKFVNRIKIKPLMQEWNLALSGAINETMDRATFESGTAEKCHQAAWVDEMGNEWLGIPLWLLVGRVDDENSHGDNAFNDELAASGYEIDVVSANEASVTFNSSEVARNNEILVVYLINGNPLVDEDFPLKLVGDGVSEGNSLGAISEIVLRFP